MPCASVAGQAVALTAKMCARSQWSNRVTSILIRSAFAALAPFAIGVVSAQQYPSKPVRMIVPYTPGGGVDIMGRLAAQKYTERSGVQFVVENRAGGGTVIGTEAVARAAPDGYTLLFTNPALSASPAL